MTEILLKQIKTLLQSINPMFDHSLESLNRLERWSNKGFSEEIT